MDNWTGVIDTWTRGAWKWEHKPRGQCTVGFGETGRVGQGGSGAVWQGALWAGEQRTRVQCQVFTNCVTSLPPVYQVFTNLIMADRVGP